jgi:hypothetical protein
LNPRWLLHQTTFRVLHLRPLGHVTNLNRVPEQGPHPQNGMLFAGSSVSGPAFSAGAPGRIFPEIGAGH